MKKRIIAVLAIALALTGCTQQEIERSYGGQATIEIPAGQKLVTATWKDANSIWYLTRPMRAGEGPETSTFREKSPSGLMEGTVTFFEHK